MLLVGLTGGIGAGKSTVARMLAEHGAVVIDADQIVRELQQPGSDALAAIRDTFGDEVVGDDGQLDRAALATIVFSDPRRLRALEAIMWPPLGREIRRRAKQAPDDAVVVVDMAILLEWQDRHGDLVEEIAVVASSEASQISHLESRGISEEDARRRMAAQIPLERKLSLAKHVIWNDGTEEELQRRVDELWDTLQSRAREATA